MAAHAEHLGAVPSEEGAGGDADLGRMSDAAAAAGAALTLLADRPAQAAAGNETSRDALAEFGERGIGGDVPVREIE